MRVMHVMAGAAEGGAFVFWCVTFCLLFRCCARVLEVAMALVTLVLLNLFIECY